MYSDSIDDLLQMARLSRPHTKLEAMQNLEARLKRLRSICDTDLTGATAEESNYLKGFAPKVSVLIMAQFIDEMPDWDDRLGFGLGTMIKAFSEFEKGRVPDWLGISTAGRPQVSDDVRELRARCAGVMEFLMQQGKSREQAAKFIWRKLRTDVAVQLAGARGTWRSVAGWRDDVAGLPVEGFEVAREGFLSMSGYFDRMDSGTHEERAEHMLKILGVTAG